MGNNEPAVDQSDFRIRDSYGLNNVIIFLYPNNTITKQYSYILHV